MEQLWAAVMPSIRRKFRYFFGFCSIVSTVRPFIHCSSYSFRRLQLVTIQDIIDGIKTWFVCSLVLAGPTSLFHLFLNVEYHFECDRFICWVLDRIESSQ